LVEQGKTMLMVTHDKELAQRVPRRIEITNGRITRDDYLMVLPQSVSLTQPAHPA
jgi:ABC-type lipoprotein export system ATPase subunit